MYRVRVPHEELFKTVKQNDPDAVGHLLSFGANIAAKDKNGSTVLHLAALEGQRDVIEALMTADNDAWKKVVNMKDALGRTALHICCTKGYTGTIQRLLQNEADVAATDQEGRTALHYAVDEGDIEKMELLLYHGANATATDQEGWTALHHAAEAGRLGVVRCLVEHMKEHKMDFNQKTNKTGATALHLAVDRGFARIVDELITNGASSTTTARDGGTALHWALEGAIATGHGLNGEDEAGLQVQDINLNDEIGNFYDGGIEGWAQGETDMDKSDSYDEVFECIFRDMSDTARWSELLKIARREERMETLQYLMSKMFPRQKAESLQAPLRRIWLAMSESRTQELMEMLWEEAREARTPEVMDRLRAEACEARTRELMEKLQTEAHEARTPEQLEKLHTEARDTTETMKKWDSMEKWDILSLATSIGNVETVYWLLRGRRWSRSDIDKARSLPGYDRLNKNAILSTDGKVWNTPIVHDEMSGRESYRWPETDPERRKLDRFESTIMDFHKIENQIVSIYYDFDTSSLMDENHGPRNTVERSMGVLGTEELGEMVRNEYSDASRCYRWIHLGINSVLWMKNLAMISYLEKDARKGEWMATWQFLQRSWQELPENRDEESYMHPICLRADLSQSKLKPGDQSTTPKHDESMRMALYMPYLTFGPFKNTSHNEDVPDEYKGGVLHGSRTLDQFYRSIQDDKRALDRDQVFTRFSDRYLRRERNNNDTEFDILRVNQLWLWVIDEKTVISSTTHGLQESEDPVFQELLKRLCQSQTMFSRETTPSSIDSFVKLITSFLINSLDNLKVSLEVPSAQTTRANPDGTIEMDQAHQIDSTKTHTASLTAVFADSIEHNNMEERSLREAFKKAMNDKTSRSKDLHSFIVRAMNALDDIKDIRHELNIINSVVQEQKVVWAQLFDQSRDGSARDDAPKEGHGGYQWSNTDPDYVSKRVKDLLHDAEGTEHNITSVLELEMNQLNLSEAEETRRQGKILMAFTIVTAVFLPLSFLSSLFALDVSTFPHSGNDLKYQPGWIFGIMFGTTLAFVLLLMFAIFHEAVFKKLRQRPGKASGPTGPQRGEIEATAGGNGHESLKKRWQALRRRRRNDQPRGVEP